MDLHVFEPSGERIYYGNTLSSLGGNFMGDMSYEQNAVEIISYNFNDPSLILNGKFTCKVAFTNCYSSCGIPIRFNLTILEGPNNDWHYYSGVVADTSTEILVSTFIVDTEVNSSSCSSIRTLNDSMCISKRKKI